MAGAFGSLSVSVAAAARSERDAVLAIWRERCTTDENVRPGETIPAPDLVFDALTEALDRPQPVDGAPDEVVQRIATLSSDFEPLITVSTRQLLHLEDAMLQRLPAALASDEVVEVRARAHVVTAWVITHVAVVRLRALALDALRYPLTKLFSKVAFRKDLEAELQRVDERDAASFVVAIDLDNFKQINDMHGHEAGDVVLKRFAAALADAVGASGAAYHLSGNEFALILRDGDPRVVVTRASDTAQAPCSYGVKRITRGCSGWTAEQAHNAADLELLGQKEAKKGWLSRLRGLLCGRRS